MNASTKPPTKLVAYENNPFFVAVNGLELLFKKAQAIGITLAVLAGLSALSAIPSLLIDSSQPSSDFGHSDNRTSSQDMGYGATQSQSAQSEEAQLEEDFAKIPAAAWAIIAVVILVVILVSSFFGIVISGIIDYTAVQLSQDKEAGLSEAFSAVFANFWGYTWVLIVAGVKTFLWTLLFIVPGVIMSIRYSLAGTVYFDKKLKGNASVQESSKLTKGLWLTTYGSVTFFNLITLRMIEALVMPGTRAILYRQYKQIDETGAEKPPAHILSWLSLILPLAFVGFIILLLLLVALLASA